MFTIPIGNLLFYVGPIEICIFVCLCRDDVRDIVVNRRSSATPIETPFFFNFVGSLRFISVVLFR